MNVTIVLRGVAEYVADVELPYRECMEYLTRIEAGDLGVAHEFVKRFDVDLAAPSAWGQIEVDHFAVSKSKANSR